MRILSWVLDCRDQRIQINPPLIWGKQWRFSFLSISSQSTKPCALYIIDPNIGKNSAMPEIWRKVFLFKWPTQLLSEVRTVWLISSCILLLSNNIHVRWKFHLKQDYTPKREAKIYCDSFAPWRKKNFYIQSIYADMVLRVFTRCIQISNFYKPTSI